MKVTTIEYGEVVSGPDYSNKKIGAHCEVDAGEKPEDAFTNLVYWVREQFYQIGMNPPEIQEVEDKLKNRQIRLEEVERELEQMKRRWKAASDFLEKHGVRVPENEIPF